MSNPSDHELDYAWNWFALHSSQRMQLVNFWLVAVAFLGAAFVQAEMSRLTSVAVGICIAGAVSSVAFLLLDRRTRELVQVAERALRGIEEERAATRSRPELRLVHLAHQQGRSRWRSYRTVIQGLQSTVAVLFLAAGVYSVLS